MNTLGEIFWQLHSTLSWGLGLDLEARSLSAGQMSFRAFIIFVVATIFIRIGNKRFMGKSTAMDAMLGFAYGSLVSRAITGNSPFFPTLAAGATLVAVHWVISSISFHSKLFGTFFKGHHTLLVEKGKIQRHATKKTHINEQDLHEALRIHGKPPHLEQVHYAYLERNGEISIILQ